MPPLRTAEIAMNEENRRWFLYKLSSSFLVVDVLLIRKRDKSRFHDRKFINSKVEISFL
jgi:hypothetical protein